MKNFFQNMNNEIYLVTASHNETDSGMIVTWVTQGSLVQENQRVVLILSPFNQTTDLLRRSGFFELHLLSEKQLELVPQFGIYSSRDKNKFENVDFRRDSKAIPIIQDSFGHALCKITNEVDLKDRIVIIADVLEQYTNSANLVPLRLESLSKLDSTILEKMSEKLRMDTERDANILK